MSDSTSLTRGMWHLLEPFHATLYYAPEAIDGAQRLGYPGSGRASYFAWRAAPLGAAGACAVTSAFYSFSPRTVAEHIPAVWRIAPPERILEARLPAVDRSLHALFGDRITDPNMAEAAGLARQAAEAAVMAGRPLAAANADLPWPAEPHLQLWHATTILREHRGDGHIVALIAAGLSPCEALVSFAATGAAPVKVFASRGWSEQEWAGATERLHERGWTDPAGHATVVGVKGRDEVERHTDELASGPWRALGPRACGRLAQLLGPLTMTVVGSGMLPRTSTLGIRSERTAA